MEKAAEKAGKAAPAMAIAGVLVAVPQAHAAAKTPVKATTVAERVHTDALVKSDKSASDKAVDRTYIVRPGDTLSSIAQRFYGDPADWPGLYHVNESVVQDPNLIYVGEKLNVPSDPPASTTSYTPRHASSTTASTTLTSSAVPGGTLGCSGLEALWEDAGGSSAAAYMAAEIAMAESGGNQYATGPYGEEGYWQINPHAWADATYDPVGNARDAIQISSDGMNWSAWTTYVTGAYQGRC